MVRPEDTDSLVEGWRMDKKVNGLLNNPPDGVEDFMALRRVCKKQKVCDQGIEPLGLS
jgi:hypothetical protein